MSTRTLSVIAGRTAFFCVMLAVPAGARAQGSAAHPAPVVTRPSPSGYTLSPERYEKAVAYSRARYRHHFAAAAWQLVVLLGLLAVRVGSRLRALAERTSRKHYVQALVFVPLLLAAVAILELPLAISRHQLSLAYDQSVQGWGSWLWDWAKGLLLGFALATPLVGLLYEILRKYPRRWWFVFWLASLPIIVFIVFLAPFVIDPLFFRFEPLARTQPELVSEIGRVVERGGLEIPPERMFLMDASRKLKSLNAYVTGFGASKRVVVWDTTLARMTTPQTLFVFGHEMGHYVLGHIVRTILFVAVVLLLLLFLAHLVLRRTLPEGRPGFGIRGLADWASLPLLLLLLSFFGELASPVVNTYSRAQEHDADVYGLEAIHGIVPDSQRSAAEAFQVLGEVNLSDPNPSPFIRFWLYSHPPLAERLVFARTYDPWSKGETPRFIRETSTP